MTQSIQNFDNRNIGNAVRQRNTAANSGIPAQAVRIPEYYIQDDKKSFKEMLEKNPMYSMVVKGFFGPLIEHPVASLFTWFGCSFLLDKYTEACGGDYNKSLLKKVINFGDKIEKSGFMKSKPMQKILGLFSKGSGKVGNIVEKNSVLRAMRDTPTMPEWTIVKQEMISQGQRVVEDFNHIVSILKLGDEGFAPLNDLALTGKEKDALKGFFKVTKISEIPPEKASSYIQLKRIKQSDDFIRKTISLPDGGVTVTKNEILKRMGQDAAWIKKVKEDTIGKYIGEVREATKKVGGKVRVGLGKSSPFGLDLGILTKPGERILGCDNVHNRLMSLEVKKGAPKTGRFLAKFMQLIHRGLTFGGGKYGVLLFIAPALVETAINVHKADPKEKIGTGVNNLVNHISWVFTFPLALQIMHHVCGAQYAGMTKDQVQTLRKLQSDFNAKNKKKGTPEGFKDYADYKDARKKVNEAMKKLKKVEGQKWYTKFVRKIAGMITPDLGKLDAYNTGNMVTKKFSQLRNLPRNLWGVPIRLLLFGFLTMGVLDVIINKGIKLIFGGSYDSAKEEEQKDAKKEQKEFLKEDLNNRLYEMQKQKIINSAANSKNVNSLENSENNAAVSHKGMPKKGRTLFKQEQKIKIDNYTYIPSQQNVIKSPIAKGKADNYTYIPSQDSVIKNDKNKNSGSAIRTYIPSQAAANITKSWDNSGLQAALNRAQRAENRALKILAGNFEGM